MKETIKPAFRKKIPADDHKNTEERLVGSFPISEELMASSKKSMPKVIFAIKNLPVLIAKKVTITKKMRVTVRFCFSIF
uniref:hypothetical protein n=1 Tax=Streptococcus uberis TaxID=1349 RepID=UPI0027DCCA62|nr:hypothetical protein [Streptococcus uberis]